MDNEFTIVNSIVVGCLGILGFFIKSMLNKKTADPIMTQNGIDDNITTALEYLRQETSADRVVVHEFHNGGTYFSGNSQQKLSISYESLSKGTSSIFRKFQNVRASALTSIIKRVMSDNIFMIDLDTETEPFLHDLRLHGSSKVKFALLRTLTNRTVGIISIHHVKCSKISLTDKEASLIDKQCKIITGYLVSHRIKI